MRTWPLSLDWLCSMKEKKWLIRTKNNHILGPVSKEKIKELLDNGSIKGDDEICCANGYWIYIREDDLVEKYIYSENIQEFNPVQEAISLPISDFPPDYSLLATPPEGPVVEHNQVNQTLVKRNPLLEQEEDQEEISSEEQKSEEQKKKPRRIIKKKIPSQQEKKNHFKSKLDVKLIYLLLFLIIIGIGALFWYKKNVLEVGEVAYELLLPSAYAQTLTPEKKKLGLMIKNS